MKMGCKLVFFSVFLIFVSCGGNKKQAPFSGGSFRICLTSGSLKYEPASIDDYSAGQIYNQIYEGLVSFDPKDLTVKPQLAAKFDVKKGGLVYEFSLRDEVYFHDLGDSKNDRKLTVEDVVYSIEKSCSPLDNKNPSAAYSLVYRDKLKGADDFFSGKAKHISGIKVKGKVISLELIRPDFSFLEKLSQTCCVVVSKKLYQKNKRHVGTGPFLLLPEHINEKNLVLLKNPDYYLTDENGFALPYLDTLNILIESKKLTQLEWFETNQLDVIYGLPVSRITEMLEGRIEDFTKKPPVFYLHSSATLRTDYYFFDMTDDRFKDKRVRQAFSHAIDKQKMGLNILHGQYSEVGNYGIVPPLKNLFRGYQFEAIRKESLNFDPQKARALLAEAGFPNGKSFGPVTLRFNIDDIHSAVADEFAKQIQTNLGINVNIDGSTFDRLSHDQENGNGDIFRTAWVADYPNPETFLQKFAGKFVPKNPKNASLLNHSRYINPLFDNFYEKAIRSKKVSERQKYFSLAELELMKDPPIIPLWYSGEFCILNYQVRNFYFNSINLLDFKKVYKKEWTTEEYQQSLQRKP